MSTSTTGRTRTKTPKAAAMTTKGLSAQATARGAKSAVLRTNQAALEATRMKAAINGVTSAIMMVDRDFVVTFVNDATRALLGKNADAFRKIWPGFDPSTIVGTCIDTFHRNPAHQRRLLADPNVLPYKTDITVGPLRFSLCVGGIFDDSGAYTGNVLEWADVTEVRRQQEINADQTSQLASISANQAVIEFKLDGTIVTANENFLSATGYGLDEIRGKHHSMFCDPAYRQSMEYRQFWEKLGRGEADAGQYRRIRKDGSDLWIQASYNPITDINGKPFKVVKYATDITGAKRAEEATKRAMAESSRVIRALAAGDLRETMQGEYEGEFAELRDALNGCVTNLRDTVSQIRAASGIIGTSADEIAQGNTDLSSRTEEQAASIAETASSMEQLTGTVKQNAENAQQANQLAGSAREQAEKGGAVVGNAIAAMSAINEASKRISDIIGVIDEIAFQTNLLALNAAVEAARAGEQGRGFAVVAAEVRNLAQRSAGAAKEIKSLIKDSGAKVDEGSRLVNDSGATLNQIVQAVKKVSDIIAEIADASAEQSTGIDRIGTAINQMDQAVQQNAALVEEAAAAAGSMAEQSRNMEALMAFFQTGEAGSGTNAAPSRPAAGARPAAKPVVASRPAAATSRPAAVTSRPAPQPAKPAARPALRPEPVAALAEAASGKWEEF